jgi:hypothetical protein
MACRHRSKTDKAGFMGIDRGWGGGIMGSELRSSLQLSLSNSLGLLGSIVPFSLHLDNLQHQRRAADARNTNL